MKQLSQPNPIQYPINLQGILLERTIQTTTLQLYNGMNPDGMSQYPIFINGIIDPSPERYMNIAVKKFQHLLNNLNKKKLFP